MSKDFGIEGVVLDEHFDRIELSVPLKGEERATAIEFYKAFKDYGVRLFSINYKDLKNILTLFYELELADIAKAKSNGVNSVVRDTKFMRLILEDKYYLEECLRQTNECRRNTNVLKKQWEIKRKFTELDAFVDLVHVQYEGAKPMGALQKHKISLSNYSYIKSPCQQGIAFFGDDYAMSADWFESCRSSVDRAVKIQRYIKDDELDAILNSLVSLWVEFADIVKPYRLKVMKAFKTATVTVCGKATKLEIVTTPQYDVNPTKLYGWYVLALNVESNQWEYTTISGWEPTTSRCFDAYYKVLYEAYLNSQIKEEQ